MELTQEQMNQIKNKKTIKFSDDDIIFLYKIAQTAAKRYGIHGEDREEYLQEFVTNFTTKHIYKYNENKSSYATFVFNYAFYERCLFFRNKRQNNKLFAIYNLDDDVLIDGDYVSTKLDNIPSPTKKELSPYYKETLIELCDKKYTTLNDYYFKGINTIELGKKNNISYQAINQRITAEKRRLKEDLKNLGYDGSEYIERY